MLDPTTYENTKCGDHQVRVVIEEKHHSRAVKHLEDEAIPSLPKSRDKAKESKRKDRGWGKDECFYKPRKIESLKVKQDQSFRYMPWIRFFPRKFKCWWSDLFRALESIGQIFLSPTCKFLSVYLDRVELNGLDRVQIKEKPPD